MLIMLFALIILYCVFKKKHTKNLTKKTPKPSLQERVCSRNLYLKWPWPCESVKCIILFKKSSMFFSTVVLGTKKHYGNDLVVSISLLEIKLTQ